ncbi:DNA methylase [Jannaschia pagri]|uniref:DNA methylase n=1 Tax=Jannaschia pagri TaxID=2829797 RepID=A0ABQ4NLF7_9RHOB|nr:MULTISPECIES: metallophosphoesterase family protein [unclassified Jannaschia]GIT91100.1 DNA methylase [Jannaschia sp. AI_61]GIT94932.1 DNA methylase [Jannaschia sp. AI_62]
MDLDLPSRIAVLADIHGNADALRAVLSDIDSHGAGLIVNLGDQFSGPLAARETAAILRSTGGVCLRGNHDRWLVEQAPEEMGASDRAAYDQLTPDDLEWLRALPSNCEMGGEIFACHATPGDDLTYWMHRVEGDGTVGPRSLAEVDALAGAERAPLLLCGHSHLAGEVILSDGRRILNPGSVGLPAYDDDVPVYHVMEAGAPDARYMILDRTEFGWDVTWRVVPYDASRMIAMAQDQGRLDWAHALATGYMPDRP